MKPGVKAIVALAMMLPIPATMYGVGYFAYGEPAEWFDEGSDKPFMFQRHFPSRWQAVVFQPMAWLESRYRGVNVELTYHAAEANP